MQNVGTCNSLRTKKVFSSLPVQSLKALFVGFTCCNNVLFVIVVSQCLYFCTV